MSSLNLPWIDTDDLTRLERRALLVWYLAEWHEVTTFEAAQFLGVSARAARRFLYALSHVLPIWEDKDVWQRLR